MSSSPSNRGAARPSRRRERRPDANLDQTIASVRAQRDFKRMLVFGLRSLSEMCAITNRQSSDNSYTCLEQNILQDLQSILTKHTNDSEIVGLLTKLVQGVASAFTTDPDEDMKLLAVEQDIMGVVSVLISQAVQCVSLGQANSWEALQSIVENLHRTGIVPCTKELLNDLVAVCQKANVSPSEGLMIASCFKASASDAELKAHILAANGPSALLHTTKQLMVARGASDKSVGDFATAAVAAVSQMIAGTDYRNAEAVKSLIVIIEHTRGRKAFKESASQLLAQLLGPSQLKEALENLNKGGEDRLNTLSLLTALSHVPAFAEQWAKEGGNEPLVNVIKHCAKQLDPNESRQVDGLIGATSMVCQIASDPQMARDLAKMGCLDALLNILKTLDPAKHATLIAPLISTVARLGEADSSAMPTIVASPAMSTVVKALNRAGKDSGDLAQSAASLSNIVSSNSEAACKAMIQSEVDLALCKQLENCGDEPDTQLLNDVLKALTSMSAVCPMDRQSKWIPAVVKAADSLHDDQPETAEILVRLLTRMAEPNDATMQKAFVDAKVADSVLELNLKYNKNSVVKAACRKLLASSVADDDLTRAVSALNKLHSNPKNNAQGMLSALAAINGLCEIDRLSDTLRSSGAQEAVVKAVGHIVGANPFPAQEVLLRSALDCLTGLQLRSPTNTGAVSMKLVSHANSSNMKTMLQAQNNADQNSVLDLLTCMKTVVAGDAFESPDGATKVLEAVSNTIRKYPEHRRVQLLCLELMTLLLQAKSADCAADFSKSGTAKQVLSFLQKATHHEEVQKFGMKALLLACQRNSQNIDALRASGAIDVVKAAARTHSNKPEIQRLHAQLAQLLTPEEQARQEVSEQIGHLQNAGRNRDLLTGQAALGALSDLTAAADASKHAARSGVGDAMTVFFDAMKTPKTSFAEMEVCSAGAVNIVKNVSVVGKPHSSLLLKHGALNLIRSIAMEAKAAGTPTAMETFAAALEGGRALLSHEKNPLYANGAAEFAKYMGEVLPSVMDQPNLLLPVIASMGLLAGTSTVKDSNFLNAIRATVPAINNANTALERQQALRCVLQMFGSSDPEVAKTMAEVFAEAGGCEAIIKLFDLYFEEEPETAELGRQILTRICVVSGDGEVLRKALMRRGGMAAVSRACKAFGRNLGNCRDDSVASAATLSLLTTFTCRMDRTDLQATGLLDVVEEIMEAHPTSRPVQAAVGGLLVNFGAEDLLLKYFSELCNLLTTKPDGCSAKMLEICKKLELFIPCPCENPSKSYVDAPRAVNLMSDYLPSAKSDPELLPSIVLVAWRLCQRFETDSSSPFGVKAMMPQMMEQLVSMIHKKDPSSLIRRSRPFVRDAYNILSMICESPEGFAALKPIVQREKFLVDTWDLFERYAKDADVSTPILRFLGNFAADQQAIDMIELGRMQATAKDLGKDSESAVLNTIKNLRRSPEAVEEGLVAVGAMTRARKGHGDETLSNDNLKTAKDLALSSPEGAAGFARMVSKIAEGDGGKTEKNDELLEDALELLIKQWNMIKDDPEVSDEAKEKVMIRLCGTAESIASRGRHQAIKKHNCPALIAEGLKALPPKKDVVGSACKAFCVFADSADLRDSLLTKATPVIVGEGSIALQSDPMPAVHGLTLILKLIEDNPEACSFMRNVNGLRETLDGVVMLARSQDKGTEAQLMELVNRIRKLINESQPVTLTLEEIHRRWSNRKENGELLDLHDNPALAPEFTFVFETSEEYSKEPMSSATDTIGREFSFGCLCFGLLHDFPDNVYKCTQMGEQTFFMAAIDSLKVEELVQYIVNNCVSALHVPEGAEAWSLVPNAATTVVEMVSRGAKTKSVTDSVKHEAFLIKRLEFMEFICHKRDFYNGTEALTVLVELWDDVEANVYSQAVLKAVVKVLRLMINEHWTDGLIMNRVSERLLEKVELKDCPHDLLADVLFCVGTMAGVVKLKNLIGELDGVEKIVDLLKRCEKAQKKSIDVSRTQQNACLALANLVLGHGLNANAFGNAKGVDLVTRIMTSSMTGRVDYDLANAASTLMCNVCFKRDDFKEALGSRGAPQAIILSIQNYDGLSSERAYRCLTSMFKGVANLALIPANVARFLDNHMTDCLVSFYGNANNIPDVLILHSLRTLSNLTLENSDTFMKEFGKLVPALLQLLESKQRTDADMLAFCFETFTSLCRYADNREVFLKNRGIEIVMGYLNSIKNEKVYEKGLGLMAVLAAHPEGGKRMVDANFYNFALSLLDDCDELSTEIVIAGLKVIRRLVADKNQAAAFVEAAPIPLITDMIVGAAHMANTDSSSAVTLVESLRVILHLLHLHPPAYGSTLDETAQVVIEPAWTRDFNQQGMSTKSKSFSRLFKSGRLRGGVSMAEDETEPNLASPSVEGSDGGSPVALDSPSLSYPGAASSTQASDTERLLKPKGPRSYEAIGLDARRVLAICKALYGMLVDTEADVLPLDRLTEYSMVILAYFTSEKVDGVAMAFTESPLELCQLIAKAFGKTKQQKCEAKVRLIFETTEFLGNVLCLVPAENIRILSKDTEAMTALKECSQALHPRKDEAIKRKVDEIYGLLNAPEDELKPSLFFPLSTYEFPLTKAEFRAEQYPNGVQDLGTHLRKKIRRGGKCSYIEMDENDKPHLAPCYWRSSADMSEFQYMNDRRLQNYDWHIPVSRVRKVERGLHGSSLARQHAKYLKLGSSTTMSMVISPCPMYPSGHELVLSFPTRFHCSRFFKRMREWQAASTV